MNGRLPHIGYEGVWISNPRIRITLPINGMPVIYGCDVCTELEMCDYVRMRVAELLLCGQFDDKLEDVSPLIEADGYSWRLQYNSDRHRYEFDKEKEEPEL